MIFNVNKYNEKINNFYEIMFQNKDIVDIRISDDKWTLKEMIAHLIDSASNNHQRIVRLQIDKRIIFPSYDPDIWKSITRINGFDFLNLINLWKEYNFLIIHLLKNIDEKNLNNILEINGTEITLKFIIEDYFGKHMDWHIELYKNRIEEINGKI